jgi:DNA-binding NtrC family response regulator
MSQQGHQILVVDDDDAIRRLVAICLAEKGYVVHGVGNGREALDWLERHDADLVLIDMLMPVMDGGELITTLRDRGHKTPIVVVTGFPDRVHDGILREVCDVVDKPFALSGLVDRVGRALKLAGQSPPM